MPKQNRGPKSVNPELIQNGYGKVLYVLELAGNKWYVGTTTQTPRERLNAHKRGAGSAWTRAHPVKRMKECEIVETATAGLKETCKTLELMQIYGVENVRGGTYCQKTLSQDQLNAINKELEYDTRVKKKIPIKPIIPRFFE